METKTDYQKQGQDFLDKTGATMEVKFSFRGPHFDDDKEKRDVYQITLSRKDRTYIFNFGQSLNNSGSDAYSSFPKKRVKPTAYDVLTCLTKYDPGTFENFCSEYGYDTDSRKAEKTYFAVQAEFANVQRLFGDVLDELAEIQ